MASTDTCWNQQNRPLMIRSSAWFVQVHVSVYKLVASTDTCPVLNLKTKEGNEQFRAISLESTKLVKKYRGSLSGEHGDGRLRGEFIPMMVGEENYELFKRIKNMLFY